MSDKIIQIIPAPANMFAEYEGEQETLSWPILCLGLTDDSDIVALTIDATGIVDDATHAENFLRVHFK